MEAPGHESGLGVVAKSEAVGNAAGDSDDVFHGAAKADAMDVAIRVDPEVGSRKKVMDFMHERSMIGGRHDRGGEFLDDFFRVAGTRQASDKRGIAKDIDGDLGEEKTGILFDPFRSDDEGACEGAQIRYLLENRAEAHGRDRFNEDFGAEDCFADIAGKLEVGVRCEMSELGMASCFGELLGRRGVSRP